jgi:cytoskeletal protein CcmA (bactofilin family)
MQRKENPSLDRASFIGQGCTFIGDISTDADVRIDGTLNGKVLRANRLFIGKEGFVNGGACCREAEIMGRVNGKLVVENLLHLHNHAIINGDIDAASLHLEVDSVYNGFLRTGKAVASIRVMKDTVGNDSAMRKRRLS